MTRLISVALLAASLATAGCDALGHWAMRGAPVRFLLEPPEPSRPAAAQRPDAILPAPYSAR
ncbi:MAG: hypothetical protein Q4F71_11285 [Paracoccus sp. (in: a-proteobacteria)]|nr:hypothetical protein [Paracoccus sp. (in: a-proteobacteria)]